MSRAARARASDWFDNLEFNLRCCLTLMQPIFTLNKHFIRKMPWACGATAAAAPGSSLCMCHVNVNVISRTALIRNRVSRRVCT